MTLEDYDLHFKPMMHDYFYTLLPVGEEDKDDVSYIRLTDAIELVEYLVNKIRQVKNMKSNMFSVKTCIDYSTEFLNSLQQDLEDDN